MKNKPSFLKDKKMINVDNVLEYKREDLEKLTDKQLKQLLHDVNDKADELFTLQQTNKILINGLYGAQGNKNFILFNEKIAQAITGNGRYFIQLVANNINRILSEKLGKEYEFVNMGDTDSVYYRIEPFVELYKKEHPNADIGEIVQFCDDFEEQYIQPIIQNTIDEFSNTLNAYNPSKISAKKETVADSILAVAKKKYIARLRESESTIYPLDSPKLKIMGLELIKSTTPNFTKKYLMQAVNILLDGTNDQLINFIKNIKNEFLKVNINDIVMVSSTNNLDYDLKGTTPIPIAARASIYYNNYITKNNLLNKYNLIQAGDKVKLVYIKDQNPFASIVKRVNGKNLIPNIIAFSNNEFAKLLKDYIDYDVQFEKSFLNPLKIMSVSINYDVEEKIPDVFDF